MWTLIHETDYDDFLNRFPQLQPFAEDLKLHTNNNYIFLPRHFYYNYPHPKLINHIDKNWYSKPLNCEFSQTLRDYQYPIVEPFINKINSNSFCGGLQARPGAGKTIMAIYISCMTNKKTLICIDNSKLAEQWMEAILNFTTATQDDIGWIRGDDFVIDRPFVIAMVQTLVSKVKRDINTYYQIMVEGSFGISFLDEYHQSSSGPRYATASLLVNTPSIIGLSATPYGQGIAHLLMTNIVGEVISKTKDYDLVPNVNLVLYDSGLSTKYNRSVLMIQDMIRRRARYNKIIVESEKYHDVVLKITKNMIDRDHRVITIAFTTDQVSSLSGYLQNKGINNRQFYSKQKYVDKVNDTNLIATYKFAGAGFDFKELSGCIIATPLTGRKSLIQVIGRVLRECKGKVNPEVYILVDTGFNGIFLREMDRIDKIISEEFNCTVNSINM